MRFNQAPRYLERLVWITGLSASGKTTVADILGDQLTNHKFKVLRLDGDQLRDAMKNSETMSKYDAESRLKNALTYSSLAKSLISQFDYVIVSTISMFSEVYITNRKTFKNYFEVYLNVPYAERSTRDPKGLYRSFGAKTTSRFFGECAKVDIPTEAHFTHIHDPKVNASQVAHLIQAHSQQHFDKFASG